MPLMQTSAARVADAKKCARAGVPAHFFLDFRPEHYRVFCSESRFKGVVAGRRWGKTITLASFNIGQITLDGCAPVLPAPLASFLAFGGGPEFFARKWSVCARFWISRE